MSNSPTYRVFITDHFKKQLKRLFKKHRGLSKSVADCLDYFEKDIAESIGKGVYKIRLQGQGKGKSGGYRMYIFVMEVDGYLSPICIYPKNEKENLTFKEMAEHLESVKRDLGDLINNLT